MGDPEAALGSWFEPGTAPALAASWEVNQRMEKSPYLCFSLSNSDNNNRTPFQKVPMQKLFYLSTLW